MAVTMRNVTGIWGHRGASAEAPENTLQAFRLAFEQGADGIELDVQRTRDGVLVVCHDETIERTSDGSGSIAELTFQQLRRHDFSNGRPGYAQVPIPTLTEVLELVSGTDRVVNIELKNSIVAYPGMEAEVEALVNEFGLSPQIWYSSFNHHSLVRLAALGTGAGLGVLYAEQLVRPWQYATGFGASALHPMALTVDSEMVAEAHRAGLRVHPWTVDDPEAIAALAQMGVDAIITNRPALARGILG